MRAHGDDVESIYSYIGCKHSLRAKQPHQRPLPFPDPSKHNRITLLPASHPHPSTPWPPYKTVNESKPKPLNHFSHHPTAPFSSASGLATPSRTPIPTGGGAPAAGPPRGRHPPGPPPPRLRRPRGGVLGEPRKPGQAGGAPRARAPLAAAAAAPPRPPPSSMVTTTTAAAAGAAAGHARAAPPGGDGGGVAGRRRRGGGRGRGQGGRPAGRAGEGAGVRRRLGDAGSQHHHAGRELRGRGERRRARKGGEGTEKGVRGMSGGGGGSSHHRCSCSRRAGSPCRWGGGSCFACSGFAVSRPADRRASADGRRAGRSDEEVRVRVRPLDGDDPLRIVADGPGGALEQRTARRAGRGRVVRLE